MCSLNKIKTSIDYNEKQLKVLSKVKNTNVIFELYLQNLFSNDIYQYIKDKTKRYIDFEQIIIKPAY